MEMTPELESFANQTLEDLAAGYAGVLISIGEKLGLYKAMAGSGPLSSISLAERCDCNERYVREWLNAQAASGYLDYHPESNCYEMQSHQAAVLADDTSPLYIPIAWNIPASMWHDEAKTVAAFKNGTGVPWGDHDGRLHCGVAAFFRNAYRANLIQLWLPAIPGAVELLNSGAKVADVGCGFGYSTALMARAFPNSTFYGFDPHQESISAAQEHAREQGVEERVRFEAHGAKTYQQSDFDLICFFDCLHDMGDPVGAAEHARSALSDRGIVMLIEPFANAELEKNLNTIGRLYYSASTTLCCAHSLSEDVGLALGAQAGPERLRKVFIEAGFETFNTVLETPFNLVIEAR
ncbi:MAG: methyltransferase domain-containing protein [Pseudomonadota bacterium]